MLTLRCVFVLVLTLASNTGSVSGLRCLQCTNIQHPDECDQVTECEQGDVCFMQEHITIGGLVQFNVGCMADRWCTGSYTADGQLVGRRYSRGSTLVTCVHCCRGDNCNLKGCGQTARDLPNRGPLCYKCKYQGGPESCRDIVGCDVNQKCFIGISHTYKQFLTTGCATPLQCQPLSHDHCPQCCEGDFCNDNCDGGKSRNTTTLIAPTVAATMQISTSKTTKSNVPHSTRITMPSTTQRQQSTAKVTQDPTSTAQRNGSTKSTTLEHVGAVRNTTSRSQTSTQVPRSTTQTRVSLSSTSTAIPQHHDSPCKGKHLTVCFVLDVPTNQSMDDFHEQLQFLVLMIHDLHIGGHGHHTPRRVCIVILSTVVTTLVTARESHQMDRQGLIDTVLNATYSPAKPGNGTSLDASHVWLIQTLTNIVVLTGGHSSSIQNTTRTFLSDAHKRSPSVDITAIGIGSNVDMHELDKMASDPGGIFTVPQMSDLPTLQTRVISRLCRVTPSSSPSS